MLACTRYWLAVMLRSQRYFPPLVLFALGVVVLTANDDGQLVSCYGACAAVLFLSVLWLTIALIGTEDPLHRAVLTVNTGSSARVTAGAVLAVIGSCAVVAGAFGLVFPAVSGQHIVTAVAVLDGAVLQLCALLCGVAVGLLCSRLVVSSVAVSLPAAIVVAIVAYLVPWVSPLHTALAVSERHVRPGRLVGELSALTVGAAALMVAAGVVAWSVASLRE